MAMAARHRGGHVAAAPVVDPPPAAGSRRAVTRPPPTHSPNGDLAVGVDTNCKVTAGILGPSTRATIPASTASIAGRGRPDEQQQMLARLEECVTQLSPADRRLYEKTLRRSLLGALAQEFRKDVEAGTCRRCPTSCRRPRTPSTRVLADPERPEHLRFLQAPPGRSYRERQAQHLRLTGPRPRSGAVRLRTGSGPRGAVRRAWGDL
jgi:hypothetical protein